MSSPVAAAEPSVSAIDQSARAAEHARSSRNFYRATFALWLVGVLTAFASAFVCVRWLIRYVATHNLVPFAWYRIAFGAVVLLTAYANLIDWRA